MRGVFIPLAFGRVFLNCPLPAHLQLTYNRFQGKNNRFQSKITRLECTTPTFSRIQVYKLDLLTYSRFTRTLAPGEGFRFLRGAPEVTALKVPSTSDQPSPSFPKAIPLPEGPGFQTRASEQPFVTFGQPKVISFATEGLGP